MTGDEIGVAAQRVRDGQVAAAVAEALEAAACALVRSFALRPTESHADALVPRTTDGRVSGGTRDPGAVSDANASKPVPVDVSDEMVDAYLCAVFTDWHIEMKGEELREDARTGLAAVVPLIRAQVLREYADRWHYVDHSRWPMSTFGAAPTPYCACGKTWPEGGCTERRNLIADAFTFHEPDEPVADVVAAFEAGEKGVTRRPVSATAIRGALYDSLSPNFEIDSEGYDDAAVAVAKLIEPNDA